MRATGSVAQLPKGGGWRSPLGLDALQAVIRERPDGTATELCRVYNRRVGQVERTTQTSFPRAMRHVGYVLEKKAATEQNRPPGCLGETRRLSEMGVVHQSATLGICR